MNHPITKQHHRLSGQSYESGVSSISSSSHQSASSCSRSSLDRLEESSGGAHLSGGGHSSGGAHSGVNHSGFNVVNVNELYQQGLKVKLVLFCIET